MSALFQAKWPPEIILSAQLFLHERETVTRNEVLKSADWIKNNLRVVEVPGLSINQTIGFASLHKTVSRQTSAAASMDRGSLVLSINGSIPETDWFEVSYVERDVLYVELIKDIERSYAEIFLPSNASSQLSLSLYTRCSLK